MIKPLIVVQGPIATRSGYGSHTRDLVRSLIAMDKYDIKIISLPWGNCPMNALNDQEPKDLPIISRLLTSNLNQQPDIFIQISVPNEFCMAHDGKTVKPGKFNIGVTAGVETTILPADCMEGCNRMDLVIATSKFTADTILKTAYDKINDKTKQKEGELKCTVPVDVLFEGLDIDVYHKTDTLDKSIVTELSQIPEQFCYLTVGHWIKGELGQDRKDIGMTIKTFCETFKGTLSKSRPALILKTSGAVFSIMDRDHIQSKISEILTPYGDSAPNVYLLHGDLTDNEMNSLYNHPKVKAMISFTKGEGYGRPLAEFATTGKPIMVSNWSGHLDFLHPMYTNLLPGQLTQVHRSASDRFLLKDAQWFTVQYAHASKVMKDIYKHYNKYLEISRKQPHHIRTNFSMEKMTERFTEILSKISIPEKVGLTLPKLKPISNVPTIQLPKLKKIEA
jgi:glycosyltransferase involved in cell wall biosynthesis